MNEKQLHFLNHNEVALLLNSIADWKHKCLILLMLDAGLRVSEAVSLQFGNFDFKNQILNVKSLKKRNKKREKSNDFANRQIPLSQRLFIALAEYSKEFSKMDCFTFLFPSTSKNRSHISRFAAYRYLKRLSIKKCNVQNLHPHALRHTFATSLVATGTELHEISDLLGHQSVDTSRIYTHIPKEQLKKSINKAAAHNGEKRSFLMKIFGFMFAKQPPIIYIPSQSKAPIVGRAPVLQSVSTLLDKGVNVILFGKYGVGKRLILDSVQSNRKILVFDDTSGIKKSLVYLLLYLYKNDKEQVFSLISDVELDKYETRLSRQTVAFLCDEIKKITEPKEYILKIKQFDSVTPQALKVIDNLKDHFVIFTAATEISITKEHFFGNFEKVEVKNLPRLQAFDLIHKLSYDVKVDNYEVYREHIWSQTDGNPRAITDMVERYKREPFLITETIRSITHSGVIREIDCSYALVILIASLAVMRYMTSELDNPALRTIGGMAMILLILTRVLVSKTKRKLI